MSIVTVKKQLILTAAGLVLLAACGSQPPSTPSGTPTQPNTLTPGSGCTTGQFNIGGYCVYAQSFEQACPMVPGGRLITLSGVQVCQMTHDLAGFYGSLNFSFQGFAFPILNTDSPQSSSAFRTGIPLKAGDKLVWTAGGGWGGVQRESFDFLGFIPATTYTIDCTYVTLAGYKKGTSTAYNYLDSRAQLMATDGTNVFPLGTSANVTIQSAGQLSMGFNVAPGTEYCSQINISSLRVKHCEDASHTTYPCP